MIKNLPYRIQEHKYLPEYKWFNKYVLVQFRLEVGHSYLEWNIFNYDYVLGVNDKGQHVFDVELVAFELRRTVSMILHLFELQPLLRTLMINGSPLALETKFVGYIISYLKEAKLLYFLRWLPGTFSNRLIIYRFWTRKKYLTIRNQRVLKWRMADKTTALRVNWLPDLLVACSLTGEFRVMAEECKTLKMPILGLVDSNANARGIVYPIRANDDTTKGLFILLILFRNCIRRGKELAMLKLKTLFNRYYQQPKKRRGITKFLKNLSKLVGRSWRKIKSKLTRDLFIENVRKARREAKIPKPKLNDDRHMDEREGRVGFTRFQLLLKYMEGTVKRQGEDLNFRLNLTSRRKNYINALESRAHYFLVRHLKLPVQFNLIFNKK
jgi:ribosomal protein S2